MRRTRSSSSSLIEALEDRRLFTAVYPSDLEQYMVELINHARANPVAEAALYGIDLNEGLSPGTISNLPAQPLAINPVLDSSASAHTQEMLQTQTFSHSGTDGSTPYDRELAAGYEFTGSWGWGENIAYISNSADVPPPEPTAQAEEENLFVDSEEPGRGHRLNLLNPAFKEVGVGMREGVFSSANSLMTTEDFAYSTGDSFLTGVVFNDANGNGLYDPGEGFSGTTITAIPVGSGAVGTTVSWSSGGYTLQLAPGVYNVTASGGSLTAPITYTNVKIGSANVEIDFNSTAPTPASTPTPAPTPTPTPTTPTPTPTPPSSPTPSGSPTATPSNPIANSSGSTPSSPSGPIPKAVPRGNGVIDGRIYEDFNDNGRLDPGDIGAPYVTVFLDTQGTATPNPAEPTSTTNTLGQFQFVGIAPGKYKVVVVAPAGWRINTSGSSDHTVRVHKGRSIASAANYFITPTASVSGTLLDDLNATGTKTAKDLGIPGWTVSLVLDNNGIGRPYQRSVTTGPAGTWSFGNLAPGTYTIRPILHKHFTLTTTTLIVGPLTDGEVSADNLIGVNR